MSDYDPFVISLRNDIKAQGMGLADVADKAKMSLRQFARHLRGARNQRGNNASQDSGRVKERAGNQCPDGRGLFAGYQERVKAKRRDPLCRADRQGA